MASDDHRAVWRSANGPIPQGFDVHHKNGDHSDNRLDNLELLPAQDHNRMHGLKRATTVPRDPVTGRFLATGKKYKGSKGHMFVWRDGRDCPEHQVVWETAHGHIPKGFDVHHINGDPADNRIENLDLIKHSEHTRMTHRGQKRSEETKRSISQAKEGCPAWNKGKSGYKAGPYRPRSKEHAAKLAAAAAARRGKPSWNKGIPWSTEMKIKMSEARKGRKNPHPGPSEEVRKRISESLKGKHPSEETRRKLSARIPWNKGRTLHTDHSNSAQVGLTADAAR